jgi:hypothetical protein
MRVSQIRFQPIQGGTLGGLFALHVTLGGEDSPELPSLKPKAVAALISGAFATLALKHPGPKGILLDCRAYREPNSEEMLELLGLFKDWGYTSILWVRDDRRYAWFEFASYITAFVASPHWINFKASEIRYIPGPWTEPDIFETNAQASLYLQPDSFSAKDVLSYVTSAKRSWGFIPETLVAPAIEFPKE